MADEVLTLCAMFPGDGTIRKSWTSVAKWHSNHGNNLHVLQIQLLKRALQLVKVGGYVVYSTCTLNPIENEAVIAQAIVESSGTVKLVPSDIGPLIRREGLTSWKVPDLNEAGTLYETYDTIPESRTRFPRNRSCSKRGLLRSMFPPQGPKGDSVTQNLKLCIRIYPHDQNTGGFFISLLQKTGEVPWKDNSSTEGVPGQSDAGDQEEDANVDAEGSTSTECARAVGTLDEYNLPADYISRVTKVERQQHRLEDLIPYTPFTETVGGLSRWSEIASFYGISDSFPHEQLVAHSDKMGIISFVSSSVRRVIDASAELARRDQTSVSNVVCAGLRMFQHNNSGYADCNYRLCLEALPRLLPFMTKRIVMVERPTFITFLEKSELPLGAVAGLEELSCGSCALKMLNSNGQHTNSAVVAWRGRGTLRL